MSPFHIIAIPFLIIAIILFIISIAFAAKNKKFTDTLIAGGFIFGFGLFMIGLGKNYDNSQPTVQRD